MAFKLTKDQQKCIDARGTVLVAAAAGSGKTAVLTRRVIERVCNPSDPATIDRLLIVTFTNASALEMRIRIGKELDKMCAEHKGNSYILKQKLLLQKAKICTIDSFCIDLVRTHFNELSVSPDFAVATPAQSAQYIKSALNSVLAKRYANPDEGFNLLCDTVGVYSGEHSLNSVILNIYNFCMCLSKPKQWLKKAVENYNVDENGNNLFLDIVYNRVISKLTSAKESIQFLLRESIGSDFESDWHETFNVELEEISAMILAANNKEWDKLYSLTSTHERPKVARIKKDQDKTLHSLMMGIREDVSNNIWSVTEDMCGDFSTVKEGLEIGKKIVKCLTEMVDEFTECYFDLLNNHNMLTFAMVEQLALKLLCDSTDEGLVASQLSKDICKLYDEVLVDEYQDNNDLQDALFSAVSDGGKHLFMVGDVKQSIYAFRNANPDNFLRKKNEYPLYDGTTDKSKIVLSANFRSREGVCDFVNEICRSLMQKSTCGMDYTNEEMLVAKADFPENSNHCVELLLNEGELDRDSVDAESVAAKIDEIMQEEPFLRDGDEGKLRKSEFGDFTILLRSPRKRAQSYIDALKRRSIPVIYDSGQFYDTDEIMTAVSLLKVIDNPTHDIPLLSCMSSVIFGFNFDEIAQIKAKYHAKNFYGRLILASKDNDAKALRTVNIISNLQKGAVTMSVRRLIDEVYSTTHFKEIVSCAENGEQKITNLNILANMASDYESFSDGGLSGFLNYFDRSAEEGSTSEKAPQKNVNAVRIMSFHGSKGLQFPICIVAGAGNNFNKTDLNDSFVISGEHGIGVNYVLGSVKSDTVARKSIRLEQELKLISEEIRLFYVAMTRAEERLILSISSKNIEKDILNAVSALGLFAELDGKVPKETVVSAMSLKKLILSAALLQKNGNNLRDIVGLEPIESNGCAEFKTIKNLILDNGKDETLNKKEKILSEFIKNDDVAHFLEDRFSFVYPYQTECEIPSKIAVTKLVHGDSEEYSFKSRPRFMSKAGLTPSERGTALHKFMQFADYSLAENDIESEILRLYEFEFISLEEAEAIDRSSLKKFFASNVYKRIKNAEKVLREYKFMVKYPYNGSETIVQGIADCIFIENGKAVILDFKTDNVNEINVLVERYSQQLEVYKSAISEIFEMQVDECIIYSMKLGVDINV